VKHRLTVREEYELRVFENELFRRKEKTMIKIVRTCVTQNVMWEIRWAERVEIIWKVTNT
jgi:hypothetical protein